jgi:protein-tyrosine phosphatase
MKVLMVCTGNICRSPMAAVMLRAALERRRCRGVEVASAGTHARFDSPASPGAAAVLRQRGLVAGTHRSRPLAEEEIGSAHLIVAMAEMHRDAIVRLAPRAAPRVRLLREIEALSAAGRVEGATTKERLRALMAAPVPGPGEFPDIEDPLVGEGPTYERCAADIEGGIEAIADLICGPAAADRAVRWRAGAVG